MGVASSLEGTTTVCKPCRLESAFEPVFAELALYDVKERKKVRHQQYAFRAVRKFVKENCYNSFACHNIAGNMCCTLWE